MKKLCVTYITTGKYNIFFSDFYKSFKMNFCNNELVTFFVFTDDPETIHRQSNNDQSVVSFIIDPVSDDPDYMKFRKFKILSQAEPMYSNFDYIFYINGNLICRDKVTVNELFNSKEQFVVPHSLWDINKNPMYEQLCRYQQSASYFNPKEPTYKYVQSGLIGCIPDRFIRMCDFIESCRCYDKFNGYDKYVPWHDETYYNKYINILLKKEPDYINILDGKIYLCSWLEELKEYRDKCKMILRNKNYCWHKLNQPLNPR